MTDSASKSSFPKLLKGKSAAITGGTTGIGLAITLSFLHHGCNVAVNHLALPTDSHHLSSLLSVAKSLKASDPEAGDLIDVPGDVRSKETGEELVTRCVGEWGGLDVFVSNAGVCGWGVFLDITPDLLETTISTNLTGAFYACQAAARQMVLQRKESPERTGSIIGISSISALVGGGLQSHYTPTKAGILSLMQSMAVALGEYGIRCNALLPGTIRTQLNEEDLSEEKLDANNIPGGKKRDMENRIPLGRLGEPGDVVGPAVFLACEGLSGYVTGAQLLVDGGLFVNLQ